VAVTDWRNLPAPKLNGQPIAMAPNDVARSVAVAPLQGAAALGTDQYLRFIAPGEPLPAEAQLVILPGSKATIADLTALRANGWDIDLLAHVRRGGRVFGICGGYQMLGRLIRDPHGMEGEIAQAPGLGLLDVETTLTDAKTLLGVTGHALAFDAPFHGYEMHVGVTSGDDCARRLLRSSAPQCPFSPSRAPPR
jgi:cobyric acid synthase